MIAGVLKRWRASRLRRRGFFVQRLREGGWVVGDPLVLYRRLMNHKHLDMGRLPEVLRQGKEPEATEAMQALAEVFGVRLWDGRQGLSEQELSDLVLAFYDHLEGLKKTPVPPPISPEPTDWPRSGTGTDATGPATAGSCADCTSTASGSNPVGP
jgi:hypothetical protein